MPDTSIAPPPSNPGRWLTVNDVAARYSCGRVTVYRMLKAGQLPPPVRFSPRMTRWDREALDAADAERTAVA
ncbi:MAG: helix-turn-helix domain-containing protein [Roseovarius sp.]|nr:helix-turn-helix domain-containing protein [Roseovarius sp.]